MPPQLHIATYNIHKGFSQFNRRMMVHELRDRLRELAPDIVFLQEVQGRHEQHAARIDAWPAAPQYHFLAGDLWDDYAYGRNAVYPHGHHGNAILSRFPILHAENENVSAHRFESRGLLHAELVVPGWDVRLHALCVHLGLFSRGRRKQVGWLRERIERDVPAGAPLIIAGDFNDWRGEVCALLGEGFGLQEVFSQHHGRTARSFPALWPLLSLDRIYVRGFAVRHAEVHHGRLWSRLSDHAALSATMTRL